LGERPQKEVQRPKRKPDKTIVGILKISQKWTGQEIRNKFLKVHTYIFYVLN
jgi:hypothetical protein